MIPSTISTTEGWHLSLVASAVARIIRKRPSQLLHSPLPGLETEPTGQSSHALLPLSANFPPGHCSHVWKSCAKRPASHGSQAPLRGGDTLPCGHWLQYAPPFSAKLPASHGSHTALPETFEIVPAGHSEQLPLLFRENFPAGHGLQRPPVLEKKPPTQGLQLPSLSSVPAGQFPSMHVLRPSSSFP